MDVYVQSVMVSLLHFISESFGLNLLFRHVCARFRRRACLEVFQTAALSCANKSKLTQLQSSS